MGRAGGGGGGHSGGGHSGGMGGGSRPGGGMGSGHSGGGHYGGGMGGGSRPGGSGGAGRPGGPGGAGRPGGPGGPGRPGGMNPPPPGRRWWGGFRFWPFGGYGYGYRPGGGCSGCLLPFVVVIAVVVVISLAATGVTKLGNSVRYGFAAATGTETGTEYDNSSSAREKADTGVAFSSDCVLDELGWLDDAEATGESLEAFYEATGVQPYVYFRAYDASLTTDEEKEDFAYEWYDENIDNQGTFLYIYFAEEDSDNDRGYDVYVNGYDIDSVMDEEAVEIFWEYLDRYWASDLSTDDMLTRTFTATANAIMQ